MPMSTRLFAGATLGVLLAAASSPAVSEKDIYDNIANNSKFTILRTALDETEQGALLKGKKERTLFAPTDDAWKKLGDAELKSIIADKERLVKIVKAHIVTDKALTRAQLKELNGQPLNGFAISTANGIKIGDAKLIDKEISCDNGFIQPIDTVLIPK